MASLIKSYVALGAGTGSRSINVTGEFIQNLVLAGATVVITLVSHEGGVWRLGHGHDYAVISTLSISKGYQISSEPSEALGPLAVKLYKAFDVDFR